MANEFVIKNGFHSKGDSQVTGSLNVSGSITGSLFGSASYAITASYALNAGGGTGVGFPYDGRTVPAVISGSLIVTGSGITVTGSLLVSGTINQLEIGTGKGSNISNVAIGAGAGNKFTPAGTTGVSNVALGSASLANTINGSANIAIGESSLNNNTSGLNNVGIGLFALASKLADKSNIVAIGTNSARNFRGEDSAFIGTDAGRYATGSYSIAIGPYAARYANGYSYSIALGYSALEGIASSQQPLAITQYNTAIGYQSMQYYVSQSNSIGIGTETLRGRPAWPLGFGYSSTSAAGYSYNIAIGRSALEFLTRGGGNTAIGYNSLQARAADTFNTASQLDNNTAIGAYALNRTLSGTGNSFIGWGSGRFLTSGSSNTAIGYLALSSTTDNPGAYTQNVAIGFSAMTNIRTGSYNVGIGTSAFNNTLNASYNVGIGVNAFFKNLDGQQNVAIGYNAYRNAESGSYNIAIGTEAALDGLNSGNRGIVIGFRAGARLHARRASQTDINSVVIGTEAMADTSVSVGNFTSVSNTVIGDRALFKTQAGSYNVGIGANVMYNSTTGQYNTILGYNAMTSSTNADNTVAVGANSLKNITTGDNNVAIGYQAGQFLNAASANNVIIGTNAGPSVLTTLSNKLYIGNAAGNPLIGGDFAAKTVTISGSLYISGSIIPNADATLTSSFELGSPTAAWNRIWVRSSSIHFVDDSGNELAKISATNAGAIEMPSIYTSGTFTAQTFVTQSTTYIVEEYHATGSNIFGSSSLDTHQFTGSVLVSGAFYISDVQQSVGNNVLTYNTNNGRLYYTASSALIGPQGPAGTSTYQSWLNLGNSGTEQDFINSLKGDVGETGPIGPTGPVGETGPAGDPGEPGLTVTDLFVNLSESLWNTTSSIQFSGSVNSLYGYTGSLFGTATTASYIDPVYISASAASYGFGSGGGSTDISALNTFTGSIQTQVNNLTAATSSYVVNSVTSSMLAPYVLTASTSSMSVLSSSYAVTASYALNAPAIDTSALIGTASFNSFTSSIQSQVNNLVVATSSYVVNSITSSMLAPYTLLSVTSSMTVLSASYASTASFISANFISASVAASGFSSATDISALNTFTGSIQTQVDSLTSATSSYITNSVTASMSVLSSSFAATASFVRTAQTASFSTTLGASLFNSGTTLSLRHSSGGILNTIDRLTAAEALTSSIALTVSQSQAGSGSNGLGTHRVALLDAFPSGEQPSPIYYDHQGITYNTLTNTLTVGGTITANSITASLEGTGSWAIQAQTASYYAGSVTSASFALTSSISTLATTASYVLQAVSASYYGGSVTSASFANTASFVNRLNQNVIVTGSVNVSGSITARTVSASFTGSLTGHVTSSAIDTAQYKLKVNNVQKVDWDLGILGLAETQSIDWTNKWLIGGGDVSVDWGNRALTDSNGAIQSIDWENRRLYDIAGNEIATYDNRNKFTVIGNVTTTLNGNSWAGALNDTHSFYTGEIHNNYTLDANYEAGFLLYLDYTIQQWTVVDQTTNSCINFLGVNTQGKGADPTVLTDGFLIMTDAANPQAGIDVYITNPLLGRPVYIIESADGSPENSFSCTIPSSGYVRVVGHVVARGSNVTDNYMIKFRPSNDWYEI